MLNMMFAGNVGGEVVVREVTVRGENVKIASFSIAVNNHKNSKGEDLPPTWIKVSVWRKYADIVAQYLKKGDHVTVTPENLHSSAWMDESGEARGSLEVTARRVDFSGNKRRNADDYSQPPNNTDDIPFC